MIGAKTLTTGALVVVAAVATWWWQPVSLEEVGAAGNTTLFWVGAFAAVAGTLVFRFWKFYEPSGYGFRYTTEHESWGDEAYFLGLGQHRITVGETDDRAIDLPPRAHHLAYVLLAFWVGLMTVDSRALGLVMDLPERLAATDSDYCPDPDAPQEALIEVDIPGCTLVRRAYAMGFAKSLGDCAPKENYEIGEVCLLRQRDEPWLHYSYRLLAGAGAQLEQVLAGDALGEVQRRFELKAQYVDSLYGAHRSVVASQPRASHHVFTNLPAPQDWVERARSTELPPKQCTQRYRGLAHRLVLDPSEPRGASRHFEHVLAQLMFDSQLAPPAGVCREYEIHWGASAESCQELIENPDAFLERTPAGSEVEKILGRHARGAELAELEVSLVSDDDTAGTGGRLWLAPADPVNPQEFVTFQCYIEEDDRRVPDYSRRQVRFAGETLDVTEIRVPPLPAHIGFAADRYYHVARMMAPGFRYGALYSEAQIDPANLEVNRKALLAGAGGYFTRLEHLQNLDILVDHPWLAQRADVLEVYPYHVHLASFVTHFRRQYRLRRRRM